MNRTEFSTLVLALAPSSSNDAGLSPACRAMARINLLASYPDWAMFDWREEAARTWVDLGLEAQEQVWQEAGRVGLKDPSTLGALEAALRRAALEAPCPTRGLALFGPPSLGIFAQVGGESLAWVH